MADQTPIFAHQHERLRWARMRAGFERIKDAAESLNIKQGTYRTYELGKADQGRAPPLTETQRICRKFKVSWVWVVTGEGSPDEGVIDPRAEALAARAKDIPPDKQDDAWAAADALFASYSRKAS